MRRFFLASLAAIAFAACISAVSFAAETGEVIFLAGKGTITDGTVKRPVEKGMKISDTSLIRLESRSVLTVRYKGRDYTISAGRELRLSSIASNVKPEAAPSPLRKLFERIRSSARTTVLAVRAEKMDSGKPIVWAEGDDSAAASSDDSAELYARLTEMLSGGDYGGTLLYYEKNRRNFGARSDDAAYTAGLSAFYLCRYDESLAIMRPLCDSAQEMTLRENALFYTAFALHSLSDYAGSNAALERFFRTGAKSPSAPYAWYIRGLNYGALGNDAEAGRCFRTIIETWPSDPIAADAAECIKK